MYYPLGAPLARTGNLVSLNAPFEMDNNRASIVSPSSSSWNKWLVQELVALTTRLLIADWYERFGAGAYLALEAGERGSGNHLAEAYAGEVMDHLRNEKAWASRGRSRRKVTPSSRPILWLYPTGQSSTGSWSLTFTLTVIWQRTLG